MLDPLSITAALGSAKNILDIARSLNDANLAMKITAEIANVQGQLIDVQQKTLAVQAENQQLRAELEKSRAYVQHHSVIWKVRKDGTEDGPYCPACIGEDREMRLTLWQRADQSREYWLTICPKGHVDPRSKPQGWSGVREDAKYAIPKDLVAKDYFFHRGVSEL